MKLVLTPFTVVTVPFPFTDKNRSKNRPALILSSDVNFNNKIGHSILAMITSAKNSPWPLDVEIKNLEIAGLPSQSVIRFKLFTLDHRLIISKIGDLSEQDIKSLKSSFQKLIPLK